MERYKVLTDSLQVGLSCVMCIVLHMLFMLFMLFYTGSCLNLCFQADRPLFMRREKEVIAKLESANAVRNAIDNAESRIEELEHQLQKCVIEKNDLEIKMEEALQDAGQIMYSLLLYSYGGSLVVLQVCKGVACCREKGH